MLTINDSHQRTTKHYAVQMAIETGTMSNVDLVWALQDLENHAQCFGSLPECGELNCRWRNNCQKLTEFVNNINKSNRKIA